MKFDIVRAWKDESYRQCLSEEQLSLLPANPAGELELSDTDLKAIHGGSLLTGLRLSRVNLFSINILASPINQTCVAVRS